MKKDKIVKNCNSSQLPWEEAVAPLGAAAHSLGTTGVSNSLKRKRKNSRKDFALGLHSL